MARRAEKQPREMREERNWKTRMALWNNAELRKLCANLGQFLFEFAMFAGVDVS